MGVRRPCVTLVWLLIVSAFQLLLGTMPMLDNFAHSFGFLMGLVCSIGFLRRLNSDKHLFTTCSRRFVRLVALVAVVCLFGLGFGVLYGVRGADAKELCPDCAKISCLSFPWGCEGEDCWWKCDQMDSKNENCKGTADYVGEKTNGKVTLQCADQANPVVLSPIDVTDWGQDFLGELCRDHCP